LPCDGARRSHRFDRPGETTGHCGIREGFSGEFDFVTEIIPLITRVFNGISMQKTATGFPKVADDAPSRHIPGDSLPKAQ
jgi:hypothetical protein